MVLTLENRFAEICPTTVLHAMQKGRSSRRSTGSEERRLADTVVSPPLPGLANPGTRRKRSRVGTALVRLTSRESRNHQPHTDERRAFPRRDSGCEVSVCLRATRQPIHPRQMAWLLRASRLKGSLVDLSMNGAAFLLNEPIHAGQEILLRIANRRFEKRVDTEARVIRSVQQDGGEWKVACDLHTKLTFAHVNELSRQLFQSEFV